MTDDEKVQALLRIKDQAPVDFDPGSSALVIVDAQRWFAEADHVFGQTLDRLVPGLADGYFERVRSHVLPGIGRLQAAFRARGRPVIFLAVGCQSVDGRDVSQWMQDFDALAERLIGERACPSSTAASFAIEASIAPLPGELVLQKTSSGVLASTGLDHTLRNLGVTSLVVCGLTTAVCVTQTARELADRSFRVVVAADACTEMSVEMHDGALRAFAYVFGRVRPTDEIESWLEVAPAAQRRA